MPPLLAHHSSANSLGGVRGAIARSSTGVCVVLGSLTIGLLSVPAAHVAASYVPRTCAQAGASTYTVASGDSWFDIALAVQVSASSLLEANGASVDTAIHPGDGLCLPAGATAPPAADGGSSCGSSGAGKYTVDSGDSWAAIAQANGVRMAQLLEANGASIDDTLLPDQVLCLPAGATPPAAKAAAKSTGTPLAALPLQGPCGFGDTWRDARANGRRHEGVDLIAGAGQYVYAVVDGTLTRRAWDQPGRIAGNAWWLTAADGSGTYFFYGHMYDFAQGLKPGSRVKAGQIIGFVGDTGSSATAHLHFEMHPNGGDPINPYPTMRAMGGCNKGTPYKQPGGWTPDTGGVAVD
jgi:murein DD-endopeptidase MepM/ murein hydrolase activator NlpD